MGYIQCITQMIMIKWVEDRGVANWGWVAGYQDIRIWNG